MRTSTVTYEQAILGSILVDSQCLGQVLAEVKPQHFATPAYRSLFLVCQNLFLEGTPVDPVTVLHAGGGAYDRDLLVQLMEVTPTAANVLHHCKALREACTLNRLADLGDKLADEAGTMDQAREVAAKINGLLVEQQAVSVSSATDTAKNFLERHAPDAKRPEYLPLGFAPLEKAIRASLGDFIILGGFPSAGKTLMCLQMALALAQKYRVGLFSFETSREKLADRLVAHLARLPLGKIQDNDLNQADWEAVAAATTQLSNLQLEIVSAAGMGFTDVEALALSRRYQVVIIDYLQLMQSTEKDRYSAVTKISMQVHTMCQRHKIACLGLSQLSRPEKQKGKPVPPDMSSLRESGQLEQDADAVILLYTADPKNNKSNRVVKVGKNKDGERIVFELEFDGATQTLRSIPETRGQRFDRINREIREAGKTQPATPEWVQQAMNAKEVPF